MAHSNEIGISIHTSATDIVAARESVQWGLGQIAAALQTQGLRVGESASTAASLRIRLRAMGAEEQEAREVVRQAGVELPVEPESFALVRLSERNEVRVAAIGADPRGLLYALLEMADRIRCAESAELALKSLTALSSVSEKTAMPIRSVTRLFVNCPERK
jgi:hypothetical protein